jgi:hypothetical protein
MYFKELYLILQENSFRKIKGLSKTPMVNEKLPLKPLALYLISVGHKTSHGTGTVVEVGGDKYLMDLD